MGILVAVLFAQDVVLFAMLGAVLGTVPDLDIHFEKTGVMKHRGIWSHSLLSSLLMSGFCLVSWYYYPYIVPFWTWLVVFAATWMHTAADSLTRSGTYLFYPLSKKRFRGPVRYDSLLANGLLITVCAVMSLVLISPGLFSFFSSLS